LTHEVERRKGDIIEAHAVLVYPHCWGKGIRTYLVTNRLVCTNGMTQQVKDCVNIVPHSESSMHKMLLEMEKMIRVWNQFCTKADAMSVTDVSREDAVKAVLKIFGKDRDEDEKENSQPRVVEAILAKFFGNAKGFETEDQTAWKLFNAATEIFTYEKKYQNDQTLTMGMICGNSQRLVEKFQSEIVTNLLKNVPSKKKQTISVKGW
jgi:hypothetical protein